MVSQKLLRILFRPASGLGLVVVGMERQGYEHSFAKLGGVWRASFYADPMTSTAGFAVGPRAGASGRAAGGRVDRASGRAGRTVDGRRVGRPGSGGVPVGGCRGSKPGSDVVALPAGEGRGRRPAS